LALSDLAGRATATFFVALAAGFFVEPAFFFAGFDGLTCALAFGRDGFFAGLFDLAGFLELFFFAELAINWEAPLVSWARAEAY
jgi:hypothetical protein